MIPSVVRKFHKRRAQEEMALAKQATNPSAKAAHKRLGELHARLVQRPDYVPLEKASRAGRPSSYWASLNLSGKNNDAEEGNEADRTASVRARFWGGTREVVTILNSAYHLPAANDEWSSLLPKR